MSASNLARTDTPASQSVPDTVRPLNLLLLCEFHDGTAATIVEHINAIADFSRHNVRVASMMGRLPPGVYLDRFDGIIIHYSLIACHDSYIEPALRRRIARFPGIKLAFVQDDYRFINDTCAALRSMGVHVLFGLASPDIIDLVYSPAALPNVRRETVLAGYVDEDLNALPVRPYEKRTIDIGYRARRLPAWLGSHAQEKSIIADKILADAPRYGLACDISTREADRIYGEDWIDFLTNSKAVLCTESGSGVCDFSGDIQRNVEAHMLRDPEATFDELRELYFKDQDGRIMMNIVSPRCFEAASLRTLMIGYEGHYSGRLEAWRHYVPLKRDHSNMDEVVAVLRDPRRAQEIIDRAYNEVALNPENSFRAMVAQFDTAIRERFQPEMASSRSPYSEAEYRRLERRAARRQRWRAARHRAVVRGVKVLDACLVYVPRPIAVRVRAMLRELYHRLARLKREFRR